MEITDIWRGSLAEAAAVLDACRRDEALLAGCEAFSELLIAAYHARGIVYACGNGGSHCDAMHFAEELTGRYRDDRPALGALALGDASHTTCVSNDYGFAEIFSRQLSALGRSGDILLGLSTSGNSENVCRAFQVARERGIKTVALLGKGGGRLRQMADINIVVPASTSDRIQEIHIKLLHTVIETVERELFPENYALQSTAPD